MRGIGPMALMLAALTVLSWGTRAGAAGIEPLPVNQKLEEEFSAHVRESQQRGEAVTPLGEPWQMLLVPALRAGQVGWCALLRELSRPLTLCPVSPLEGSPAEGSSILYEGWEGAPPGTFGYVLTAPQVTAVTVNQGSRVAVATAAVPGLTVAVRAAVVSIPAPFPGPWPDQFEGVEGGHILQRGTGYGSPSLTPSLTLATSAWQPPVAAPSARCELSADALKGLTLRAGRVVPVISALARVAGRGFTSCADSEYLLGRYTLDAAILLDAGEPGRPPVALPNATPVRGRPGLYSAPGRRAEILGMRISGGWLVLEGGAGLAQRELVLAHLHARLAL